MNRRFSGILKRPGFPAIYSRLVLGFLCAIVPMYVAAMLMNDAASRSLKQEITQSLSARTHFFLGAFEQELRSTGVLINELSQDSDMQRLGAMASAMGIYDYFQAVDRIQSKMRLLQSSNQYVTAAQAYIPLIGKTIQGTSYIEAMPRDNITALQLKGEGPIIEWNGELQLGEVYPDGFRNGKEPNFAIVSRLSIPSIEQALEQLAGGNGGAALAALDGKWALYSDTNDKVASSLVQQLDLDAFSGDSLSYTSQMDVAGSRYWFNAEKSPYLNTLLIVYSPEAELLGPLGKYRYMFYGLSLFSALVIILFSAWIYSRIHQPLTRMVRAFRRLDLDNWQVELYHGHRDEFLYLYEQFNLMVQRMRLLVEEAYEQKIHSQRSELKQLQSQINPHFLYNSFFTLHQMAELYDFDNIIRLTKHLGAYFKFITRNASDKVPLKAELEHARSYAEIQTIRFHRRIAVHWEELPVGWEAFEVPVLIVQPLIENAYLHGLEDKEAGGIIAVGLTETADGLQLSIEDNGDSLTDELLEQLRRKLEEKRGSGEVTGVVNVHRRLRLEFGAAGGLKLMRGNSGGLRIVAAFPRKGEDGLVPNIDRG